VRKHGRSIPLAFVTPKQSSKRARNVKSNISAPRFISACNKRMQVEASFSLRNLIEFRQAKKQIKLARTTRICVAPQCGAYTTETIHARIRRTSYYGATSKPLMSISRTVSKTSNLDKESGVKTVRLSDGPVDPLERSATWDYLVRKVKHYGITRSGC
jgi:hypothetical protein